MSQEFFRKLGDYMLEIYVADEIPLSNVPATIEIIAAGDLICRLEVSRNEVKDAHGKPCMVTTIVETSNNVGETEQ